MDMEKSLTKILNKMRELKRLGLLIICGLVAYITMALGLFASLQTGSFALPGLSGILGIVLAVKLWKIGTVKIG